ncbi:family 11 glycosyl hydrolase, partial [Roridomyces roridus]
YSLRWDAGAQFLGGKGWEAGSSDTYSSTAFNSADLLLYGVTTSEPAIEYFIVEAISPRTAAQLAVQPILGTIDADDGVYDVYATIANDATPQYWSVRQSARDGGVITPSTHFASWTALGMPAGAVGALGLQLVAVRNEEAEESGSIDVTILNAFNVRTFRSKVSY